jgi:nucleoside-diphosphate-sugar epimerase
LSQGREADPITLTGAPPAADPSGTGRRQVRFLVTGAAGFIGANLCRRLLLEDRETHVLVRAATATWRLEAIADRLHWHRADITDANAIERVIDEARPTVVYHLATHGAYHYQNNAEEILRTNVMGLWNLVRACSRTGCELLVNTGSSSEYGTKRFAMRETDVLDPNSFYAVAKAAQSLLCQHVGRTGATAIVTLRPFSVYGPYEEPTRLIPRLMMAALDGTPIDMVSPDTVRDFVFIDDVVDVYLAIDKLKAVSGEIINVGTGVQTSLQQLVGALGVPVQARWNALAPRSWDSSVWVADISKLRRLLGLTPRLTVEQGLARSLPWFREHRQWYAHPTSDAL